MNVMEIVLKITVTLVIVIFVYFQICILKWTWTNQIDPKATLNRILNRAKPDTDFIAIRDPNKIYQQGSPVGDVTGDVVIRGDLTEFEELSNTQELNRDAPFEYRRDRYKIERVGSLVGMSIGLASAGESERKEAVLGNVICRKVQ